MARHTRHFERVSDIRNDVAKLSPARWPNRIAAGLARADRLEKAYREAGIWKKTCGQFCECKKLNLGEN
jgi:hypothetical protein